MVATSLVKSFVHGHFRTGPDGTLHFVQPYQNSQSIAPKDSFMPIHTGGALPVTPQQDWQTNGVNSASFKSWFGDFASDPRNASKVVSSDGQPAQVTFSSNPEPAYGSDLQFTAQPIQKAAQQALQEGSDDVAQSLRPQLADAAETLLQKFGGKHLHPDARSLFMQSGDKELLSSPSDQPSVSAQIDQAHAKMQGQQVAPVYLNIRNPIVMDRAVPAQVLQRLADVDPPALKACQRETIGDGWTEKTWQRHVKGATLLNALHSLDRQDDIARVLGNLGFDGIRAPDRWIAFQPEQVKSSDNSGTFDSESPDMLKSQEVMDFGEPVPASEPRYDLHVPKGNPLDNPLIAGPKLAFALDNKGNPTEYENPIGRALINHAKATVNSVHGFMPNGETSQVSYKPPNKYDVFNITKAPQGSYFPRSREIKIETKALYPEFTILHELGHHLDLTHMGSIPDQYGKEQYWSETPDADHMMDVIRDSPNSGILRDKRDDPDLDDGDGQVQHANYLLQRREMFARAYAQYIQHRSGDPVLSEHLKGYHDKALKTGFPMQWGREDFEPIAHEFDREFHARGWRGLPEQEGL